MDESVFDLGESNWNIELTINLKLLHEQESFGCKVNIYEKLDLNKKAYAFVLIEDIIYYLVW
jgi:hypothetical protein